MQHIETVTVGSGGAASITFMAVGDIPSDYTDLVLKLSLRSTESGVTTATVDLNSTAPTARWLRGNGATASSGTDPVLLFNGTSTTANTFSNVEVYIPNYRSSAQKSGSVDLVVESNSASSFVYQYIYALLWNVTDPVTSITINDDYGSFVEFSSASLYGITAGSDGIVAVS
jgi:hypothetical protein